MTFLPAAQFRVGFLALSLRIPLPLFAGVILSIVAVFAAGQDASPPPRDSDLDQQLAGLRERLMHGDEQEQRRSAYALGQLGSRAASAVPVLTQALASESPAVRRYAADALGRIGSSANEAAAELARRLSDGKDDVPFQIVAARSLGRLGVSDAEVLLRLDELLNAPEFGLRVQAAAARYRLQASPASLEALLQVARRPDTSSSFEAVMALGQLGVASQPPVEPVLVELLASPSRDVRRAAAEALSHSETPPLDAILETMGQWPTAVLPGLYLLRRRAAGIREAIFYSPNAGSEQFAEAAREMLTKIAPALQAGIGDERQQVRQAAAEGLAQIGPLIIPLLIAALSDKSPQIRRSAQDAAIRLEGRLPSNWRELAPLDQLRRGRILADLTRSIPQAPQDSRAALLRLFHALSYDREDLDRRMIEALQSAAGDQDLQVRQIARKALRRLAGTAAQP